MSETLTQILSGAGLAGAAGHRAFLPPLLLGLTHKLAAATAAAGEAPFFELSQKFQWLSDPKVLAVLAVLAVVEFIAEKNPDAPEIVNLALKLPKAVSGFLVAAAATGRVDENLLALSASGVLGGGIALGVDKLRADVKHAVQQPLSDATHGASDKAMGWAETAWSGFVAVMAWVIPVLAVLCVLVVVGVWFARRKFEDSGRLPCPKCGHRVLPGARVCAGCKADLAGAVAASPTSSPTAPASAPPTDLPVV
jgi:hypothetical protein